MKKNAFPLIEPDEKWLKTLQQAQNWFTAPAGEMLLSAEKNCLSDVLSSLFGHYLIHYGPTPAPQTRGAIAHGFHAGPLPGADVICDECAWPFMEHTADAVVLQHGLDFCQSPHHLLREAAKTVRPGGHLIVIGLNPSSSWGMAHHFSKDALRHARCIAPRRLSDWLNLLGFAIEERRYGCYRPPLTSFKWQSRLQLLESWGPHLRTRGGGFYLVLSRKLNAGLRPLRLGKNEAIRDRLVSIPVAGVGRRS